MFEKHKSPTRVAKFKSVPYIQWINHSLVASTVPIQVWYLSSKWFIKYLAINAEMKTSSLILTLWLKKEKG